MLPEQSPPLAPGLAPADATHALRRPGAAIIWLKLGARNERAYWWRRNRAWVQGVHCSGYWLDDPQVVQSVQDAE